MTTTSLPMTWDYRVVDLQQGEALVLCEVFYQKNKIIGWATLNRGPIGSSVTHKWSSSAARKEAKRELASDLKKMQAALKRPIIKISKLRHIQSHL